MIPLVIGFAGGKSNDQRLLRDGGFCSEKPKLPLGKPAGFCVCAAERDRPAGTQEIVQLVPSIEYMPLAWFAQCMFFGNREAVKALSPG